MSYHVDIIPNRNSPPAILLRKAWREGKRIRKKTLGNLSELPPDIIDGIRRLLKGGLVFDAPGDAVSILRSLPHGHVCATLGMARKLGLARILGRSRSRARDLALAAVVSRVIAPGSRLATARRLSPQSADCSLGAVLGLGPVSGNEMLDMLDWLLGRQRHIERSLANRHLGGTLILYDVTSSFLEGQCCPLAAFGHNRDGKKGKKQIVFGLLCAADGCPVAVEVFAGNTADPMTVGAQVAKLRARFGIDRVAMVGDRGMLTSARIRDDLGPAGLDWISALRAGDVRKLLKDGADGSPAPLRPGELAADAVAEIASPDFPGERLVACLNPRLRQQRARKREALLAATEAALREIADAAERAPPGPKNRDRANRAVGARANRWKMRKHFRIEAREDGLSWSRDRAKIDAEAALDGIYIIRTSLGAEDIAAAEAVEAYKSLSQVERAFRSMKATRLEVRPVHVYNANRVRAHVFLCMLAWYVEWHMRQCLAPTLFEDDDREAARARRTSPVEKAETSDSAKAKAATKTTPDGLPVHSFDTLLDDLATLTLNRMSLSSAPDHHFDIVAEPTPLQRRALSLLDISPDKMFPV